jgi:hypothetical protein
LLLEGKRRENAEFANDGVHGETSSQRCPTSADVMVQEGSGTSRLAGKCAPAHRGIIRTEYEPK